MPPPLHPGLSSSGRTCYITGHALRRMLRAPSGGREGRTMADRTSPVSRESIPRTVRHEGRDVVLVSEEGGVLLTRPGPEVRVEERDDRSLYYSLVLEEAHSRAVAGGRLLDLYDADPDRLMDFLAARDWQPLEDGRAGLTAPLSVEGAEATLEGTIHLLGADGLLKPRLYQAVLEGSGGASCLTLAERASWVGTMPLRVAPLRTVLLVGLDETNVELARGLRGLGLRVLLAQQAGASRREVFLGLHDGGLAAAVGPEGPVAFDKVSGEALRAGGPSLLPLPEAAVLEFLQPLLGGAGDEPPEEGVEAAFDLTLPTTVPYGEKNRHSTDDVTFRAASGVEEGVLDA